MTASEGWELISGREHYARVVEDRVLGARDTVWVATANLKDIHVEMARGYRPILHVFDEMAGRGVRFRIVHADIPSRPFRDTLDACPNLLAGGLELQICPRSHWKMVIVDGKFAYLGSANFTGAGLGVKKAARRNLELGVISREPALVGDLVGLFDRFWIGEECVECAFTGTCPDPIP